jgi:hypothetical protein
MAELGRPTFWERAPMSSPFFLGYLWGVRSVLIENVNRDPLRGVLHDRQATAYRPLGGDEVPMTARDAAAAHSDTEDATRTIADQRY